MTSNWKLKGVVTLPKGHKVVWNPRLSLYLVLTDKKIAVNRVIDGQQIAAVNLRDEHEIVGIQWEKNEGKLFAVFQSNGAVRIYDCSIGGSLREMVNLVEEGQAAEVKVDAVVWMTVEWAKFPESYRGLDFDITTLMPGMVRLVRDSKQLSLAPLDLGKLSWLDGKYGDAAIFLAHDCESTEYMVAIDGQLSLRFPSGIRNVHKILPQGGSGSFLAVGKDGTLQWVTLKFLECALMRELVKSSGQIRFLCRYLAENVSLCHTELIEPYRVFLTRLMGAYEGDDLATRLRDILLTGYIPDDLEDWLCNSVGDKNYKRWKQLSTRMYGDLNNVLTLAVVPACERLILAAERMQGIHKSLKLQRFYKDFAGELTTVELQTLISECQTLLEFTLNLITELNRDAALHQVFAEWFYDVVMETVDEDYKRPSRDGIPLDSYGLDQYLSYCWQSSETIQRFETSLPELAARPGVSAALLDRKYTREWLLADIHVTETVHVDNDIRAGFDEVLDAVASDFRAAIAYRTTTPQQSSAAECLTVASVEPPRDGFSCSPASQPVLPTIKHARLEQPDHVTGALIFLHEGPCACDEHLPFPPASTVKSPAAEPTPEVTTTTTTTATATATATATPIPATTNSGLPLSCTVLLLHSTPSQLSSTDISHGLHPTTVSPVTIPINLPAPSSPAPSPLQSLSGTMRVAARCSSHGTTTAHIASVHSDSTMSVFEMSRETSLPHPNLGVSGYPM